MEWYEMHIYAQKLMVLNLAKHETKQNIRLKRNKTKQ